MISVKVFQTKDSQIRSFQLSGHAEYAEEGQDIVCSAVSALVINFINSLSMYTSQAFDTDSDELSGTIIVNFLSDLTHDGKLLVDSLLLGLRNIENDYNGQYIHVDFREV